MRNSGGVGRPHVGYPVNDAQQTLFIKGTCAVSLQTISGVLRVCKICLLEAARS